jgi:hypothetical protein
VDKSRVKESLTSSSYQRGWYIDPIKTYKCSELTTDSCAWVYAYKQALNPKEDMKGIMAGWYANNYKNTSWWKGTFNIKENIHWTAGSPATFPCDDDAVYRFIVHVLFKHADSDVWHAMLQDKNSDKDLKGHTWEKRFAVGTALNDDGLFNINFIKFESVDKKNCPNWADETNNYFEYTASCTNQISYYLSRNDVYKGNPPKRERAEQVRMGCKRPDCIGKDKGTTRCPTPKTDCSDPKNANLAICLDCKGKDKEKKECLDCKGKDITNKICYDCEGKDKNSQICNDCPMKKVTDMDGFKGRKPGMCGATMKRCPSDNPKENEAMQ